MSVEGLGSKGVGLRVVKVQAQRLFSNTEMFGGLFRILRRSGVRVEDPFDSSRSADLCRREPRGLPLQGKKGPLNPMLNPES